jgi:8-oxo-dGTP pyrophosphatase MutT (NUDIX family)
LCRNQGGSLWVALIVARGDTRWQLPKGWLEQGETASEAALREVQEETGLRASIQDKLGTIDYWFRGRDAVRVHKFVTFFLMACESGDISEYDPAEVETAQWVSMAEAMNLISFDSERAILRRAKDAWIGHRTVEGRLCPTST